MCNLSQGIEEKGIAIGAAREKVLDVKTPMELAHKTRTSTDTGSRNNE